MSKLDYDTAVKQETAYLRRLHPTPDDIPGCLSLFNTFLECHTTRSQFKSLYRQGETTDCARKFEDFKFCLTLKSLHPEERRDAWIQRRAEWWAERRLNRSSEDVWYIKE
ncbi:hypothetical protein F5887DRAFT_1096576 [Amanita rubescens]|nr:hypothetical protein F5887DRAFT_1096576 [Amanita rubescens]